MDQGLRTDGPRTTAPAAARRRRRGGGAGFTLVELLVAIAIIALLATISIVAFSAVFTGGKRAATQQFLQSLSVGLEQFKADFNYYPPLIDGHKHALESLATADEAREEAIDNRFKSIYSLPLYLVGVGDLAPGTRPLADADFDDGKQGPGFRDPGPDRSWGGAAERDDHKPIKTGRVYGPYIDVGSGQNFRQVRATDIDGGEPPGLTLDDIKGLYVFEDRWGTPIRYYRSWPVRSTAQRDRYSLERTPIELLSHRTVAAKSAGAAASLDPALEKDLLNAPYALLSAGEDLEFSNAPFANDLITDVFSNSERMDSTLDDESRKALVKSLEDNVRHTP